MSLIELSGVFKSFGQTQVLNAVNLQIDKGEQCALVGASGSGKSTLLYLLGGLDRPSQGVIKVDGKDLSKMNDSDLAVYRNQFVGFVFQFHFLLPSMSCLNNILLPTRIGGGDIQESKKTSEKLAETLGVAHCLDKMPYQISGGEQQRINIIRALSQRPKLLLCDEPTGNLDSQNSEKVCTLLKQLANEFEASLLIVTHDEKVARHFSRKITIEDGRIIS
ncbi:MAG: ABC transporter ATP-binding protein [Bacteriovoracaceae bacterium]|nr:ABC transporter ATP-binding protein [Bacteriovoracaceae bacterium]